MDVAAFVQRYAALSPERKRQFIARLQPAAVRELERLTVSLMRYVPRFSPSYKSPSHLRQMVDVFEAALHSEQRVLISAPPQHGKTIVATHAVPWFLGKRPEKRCAYITYAAARAHTISENMKLLAAEAGIRTKGGRAFWETKQKGGLIATGIGGPLTGYGIDGIMLIDDPVKNRAEAESPLYRQRNDEWFRDVAYTRVHPGASVIVIQTRWHEDDLSGRLKKRGWHCINLEAVATKDSAYRKAGEALWEAGRPAAFLEQVRLEVGEYTWWSLYQGEPRPRGGALFKSATNYEGGPNLDEGFEVAIGIDLAYSKKTHADYSVAVVMARAIRRDHKKLPVFRVLEVVRKQCRAPEFKTELRRLKRKYPTAKMRWYASGTEQGVGDLLSLSDGAERGLDLNVLPAVSDKFVRAQPVAAAWNDGRVLVPGVVSAYATDPQDDSDADAAGEAYAEWERKVAPPEWVGDFVGEILDFTGVNDPHDDQVDALAAAYDELAPTSDLEFFNQMSTL